MTHDQMVVTREEILKRLERCYTKWVICHRSMVGQIYPAVVEYRYLVPLRRKINELSRPGALSHWVR